MSRRHERLEALFLACLDLPASRREAFLAEQAGDDPALVREVLDLLEGDSRSGDLESPLFAGREDEPPEIIGPYRLHRKLGEGGFGTVWEAEQVTPVRRRVAIKILKAGMDSAAILARFEAERHALALMDHPGVARVYDAGRTESGRSYFVMELVAGESITADCDRHRRPLRERLRLFADVCRAVQHAHQKGVIHRDLKASNIMVATADGRPLPKVIDFGIAKAAVPAPGSTLTRPGEFLGTPEYMSPEQASSGGVDVDTRTDVYSLGVILYRLVTGHLPFDSARLRQAGLAGMIRILGTEEPPRPSERVRMRPRDEGDPPSPAGPRDLQGDLDWIVLKAMEKDRHLRYASPAALADDIERHLRNEPVVAGPPSTTYRLRKLVLRHRALVIGAAAVLAALVLGLAATAYQAVRATRAEALARREAETATAVNAFLTRMLAAANPQSNPKGREVTVREIVDRAAAELSKPSGIAPEVEASVRHSLAMTYMGLSRHEPAMEQIRRAIDIRGRAGGMHSLPAIESRLVLAELEELQGRFAASESLMAGLAASFQVSGAGRDEALASFHHIQGSILFRQDRLAEADSVTSLAVERRRRGAAGDPTRLVASLALLTSIRAERVRYDDALPAAREALDVTLRAHGREHHDVAVAAGHLANLLRRMGRYAAAESLYREAIDIDRKVLGPDHHFLGQSLSNLGIALDEQGRLREAEEAHREAYSILRTAMGEDHHLVTTAMSNLATTIQKQGRLEEALALRLPALERERRAFGEGSEVALALNNLGSLYRLLKRYPEAVTAFREARAIFLRVRGAEHPSTVASINNLGKTLFEAGRFEEAETALRTAIAEGRTAFPDGHPTGAFILANLGMTLVALERRAEAESVLVTAHSRIAAGLGPGHPRALEAAQWLATLYDAWGRSEDRDRWRELATVPVHQPPPP